MNVIIFLIHAILLLIAAALGFAVSTRRRTSDTEIARLSNLLELIRQNQAPIEELANVHDHLQPIAESVQHLLHELRQQKRSIAELNAEVDQRIANRTDALERLIGSLRNQAIRDVLTGLYNRRMLDDLLPRLVENARAGGTSLALMMIDVNHFKDLNDTLGHGAGDEMLRNIGQIILSTIRQGDHAFRVGGDEFVIVLPGCPTDAARRVADRLQSLTDGMATALKPQPPARVGLSIGLCMLSELENPSCQTLLARADELLYECKAAHRRISRIVAAVPAVARPA